MNRRQGPQAVIRLWAALALVALLIGGAAVALGGRQRPDVLPARAAAERPTLLVLTSLPLIFPENFGLEGGGSAALTALERRYQVQPIDIADAQSLRGGKLLLMAHPLAQPPEALVALDKWVRGGGRVLLLADPRLDWPSARPLGDRLRPPPAFADTGLLKRWGLTLYAPDVTGPTARQVGGRHILASSPGTLAGACGIESGGLVARCIIERGKATIVADADFLRSDEPDSDSVQFLMAELNLAEAR